MDQNRSGNLFNNSIIILVGVLIGIIVIYASISAPIEKEFIVLASLFIVVTLAVYFFYIFVIPEASIPFIICSSWLVFFEPAPFDIFAGLAIPAFILNIVVSGRSIPRIHFTEIILLVFMILNLNNVITTDDVPSSLRFFFITVFLIAMSFLISKLSNSYRIIRRQLNLFFIPCIVTSFALFLGYVGDFLDINLGMLHDILVPEGRASGLFKDANVAGPSLILPAIYSFATILNTKSKDKLLFLFLFLLSVIGIFSTLSRGAILALIFGILVVLSLSIDRRSFLRIILSMLLVTAVLFAVLLWFPKTNIFWRIFDIQFGVQDRIERIERGIEAFKQKPIIGSGMELRMRRAPHDTYFLLLQQIGLIGFLCFWFPIIYLIWKLLINCKHCTHENDKVMLLSLGVSLLSHMILGLVIYLIHWRHFWYSVGLAIAAVRLVNIESQDLSDENAED